MVRTTLASAALALVLGGALAACEDMNSGAPSAGASGANTSATTSGGYSGSSSTSTPKGTSTNTTTPQGSSTSGSENPNPNSPH